MWTNFSISTVTDISDALPTVEQLKNGNNASSQFQNKVSQKISDFEVLRSGTIQRNAKLNPISSISGAQEGGQKTVKLSTFKNAASKKKSELKGMWEARQNVRQLCKVFWC